MKYFLINKISASEVDSVARWPGHRQAMMTFL